MGHERGILCQQQNSESPIATPSCDFSCLEAEAGGSACAAERGPKKNKQQPVAGRPCGCCRGSRWRGGRESRWRGDVWAHFRGAFRGLAAPRAPPGVLLCGGDAFILLVVADDASARFCETCCFLNELTGAQRGWAVDGRHTAASPDRKKTAMIGGYQAGALSLNSFSGLVVGELV